MILALFVVGNIINMGYLSLCSVILCTVKKKYTAITLLYIYLIFLPLKTETAHPGSLKML